MNIPTHQGQYKSVYQDLGAQPENTQKENKACCLITSNEKEWLLRKCIKNTEEENFELSQRVLSPVLKSQMLKEEANVQEVQQES